MTIGVLFAWSILGCGTTRMSDTLRTGTEQILLSTAIDRSVNDMDFSQLEGKDIYFDPQYLKGALTRATLSVLFARSFWLPVFF